ncbi:MAG TPA: hypothetical protein VLE69_00210 [Candidatus Saccharimonadales bacterium]|nr:hypothetical protein [Candidatus Saccharimonadales bacterium]
MKYTSLSKNEDGVMAIVVTVIVLIIISITTIGFARISRREENQALDRQLSSEANYAAESGINDVVKAINAGTFNPNGLPKTDCPTNATITPSATSPTGSSITLPASITSLLGGVTSSSQFTCLLIKTVVPNLKYSAVFPPSSPTADFSTTNAAGTPTNAAEIMIGWSGPSAGQTFWPNGSNLTFPNPATWGTNTNEPLMRVDLTNITGGGYTRNGMIANSYTGYFYPVKGTAAGQYGATGDISTLIGDVNRGQIVGANCWSPQTPNAHVTEDCNVSINVASLAANHFLMHLRSIFFGSNVTVTALDGSGSPLSITGGQVVIDATGRANDVVKREQVRISPRAPNAGVADYAIQSADSICKRLITSTVGTSADGSVPGLDQTGACAP